MSKVKIILEEGVTMPAVATKGAAAVDLCAHIEQPVLIRAQAEAILIPTGIKLDMTATPGLCALVLPRSGLGHKQGLVLGNGVGLIDNDYQGEIFVSAWNRNPVAQRNGMGASVANAPIEIKPGMRLAQLMFLQAATSEVSFQKVTSFKASDRGEGGFGSTGTEG